MVDVGSSSETVFPCSSVWTKDLSLNEWIGFVAAA